MSEVKGGRHPGGRHREVMAGGIFCRVNKLLFEKEHFKGINILVAGE